MPKLILNPKRTHPVVWCGAIICTIIAIAVIIAGLVLFVGYMIIHPTVPFITITYAHLDKFDFDQVGQMDIQITLVVKAENDNSQAHATFSNLRFFLYFQRLQIAELTAEAFDVPKNKSKELQYIVPSLSIPLERQAMEEVDASLKLGRIAFDLKGAVRTQWRIGVIGSVKFWSNMSCQLKFLTVNGTSINSRCSSKSN
ncbi:Late embryogenesis abundant protein [Thalictrum thalictroides]|uniref:Late embryogenesis abundant protein n=1 Tax=Thalictrum thalictroides TaxID=46969 RepID=A0A7J6V0M5_THATH|nr:Late embryogenesis abundant protein [Thalictrum thalictroides]